MSIAPPVEISPVSFPDEVEAFCLAHGLAGHLSTAVKLARTCFDPITLQIELDQDDDTDEQWIVVRVDVRGSQESVLAAKQRYTGAWVAAVPWPERHSINLSFNIV
jgi:hypothetical protein